MCVRNLILALTALANISAAPVERWFTVSSGSVNGRHIYVAVDETWPHSSGAIISAHWQMVYVEAPLNGVKELRFIDRVDCDRERRAQTREEQYDEGGNLLRVKETPLSDLKWESIANDSPIAKADGWACLKP